MRPLAVASSPGGQLHIVGRDGLLVRFLDGEGKDIIPRKDRVWTRDALAARNYLLLLARSQYNAELEFSLARKMVERGVEGLVLVGSTRAPEVQCDARDMNAPAWNDATRSDVLTALRRGDASFAAATAAPIASPSRTSRATSSGSPARSSTASSPVRVARSP